MIEGMQQLVRYTRIQEIVGDVIRLQASGVALGDMAEVENTDGEMSLSSCHRLGSEPGQFAGLRRGQRTIHRRHGPVPR